MNKFDLFRAFQDISPDLIEEAEKLTVSEPESRSERSTDPPIFLRTHEEEIMGKHSKPFRILASAAAAVAICSIAAAGYFAIKPNLAAEQDSTVSQSAESSDSINAAFTESTTAAMTTTVSALPDDFVEETVPSEQDTDQIQDDPDEEDEQRYNTGGFLFGGHFSSAADQPASHVQNVVNSKKMSIDLNTILIPYDHNQPKHIPTTIVLMQDGEVVPFALTENGTPDTSQEIIIETPQIDTLFSDELQVILNDGLKRDRIDKIIERLKEIDGVQSTRYDDSVPTMLFVKLTSSLITNDDNLYTEICQKMQKIYGISYISRSVSDQSYEDYMASAGNTTLWFTPHCRAENTILSAAIIYHYSDSDDPANDSLLFSASVPLHCSNPDTGSDTSSVCTIASDADYIDFPEGVSVYGSDGINIGEKQDYGPDSGPHKYRIDNYYWDEDTMIGRDEVYLKAHFDPENTSNGYNEVPDSLYALLLCDGKPMGLANGKDILYFETDSAKTLNFRLTLDDSIPDGKHSFSVFMVSPYNPDYSAIDFNWSPNSEQSCILNIHS